MPVANTGKRMNLLAVLSFYRKAGSLASVIYELGGDIIMDDLKNEIIMAGERIADLNQMIDLAAHNWDAGWPINELLSFISTACYINDFLIDELRERIAKLPTAAK